MTNINKNIDTMSNIVYNSIKRDIKQSNLDFWKNNVLPKIEHNKLNKDVFEKVVEKAEKDKNYNIVDIIKNWIEKYKEKVQ